MAWQSLRVIALTALAIVCLPRGAQARTIEVSTARVRMGDLLADVPEPWASLDMGAAPEPMQEARYTKADIEARIDTARLPQPQGLVVPRVLRVVRCGQVVSEPHLANLVRQSLISHLPPGTRLKSVRLSGGAALPSGPISIVPEAGQSLGDADSGAQVWRLVVSAGADKRVAASVLIEAVVDIELPQKQHRVPVLSRGSEVTLQVRSRGVLVQGSGLAQEAGSIGDLIKVLPNQGSRMVQARIVDARTVEVRL